MTEERLAELMVKVVDQVATAEEREALMSHIQGDVEMQKELEAHMAIKAVTDGWVQRLDYDLSLDRHDAQPVWAALRALGVGLLVLGFTVLGAWGVVELFIDPEAPLWLKIGVGLCGAGIWLLALSVVRWRWVTHRDDAYREVIR